jgi:hypothetical protein
MGKHPRLRVGLSALLGIAIALFPPAAPARTCRAGAPVVPSHTQRLFQVPALGLSLVIPSNYRSMLRSNGHITFHDPISFEYIQCLARRGEYGEVPLYVTLEIYQGVIPDADLVQVIRRKRPWVDYYRPEYRPLEVAGRPMLEYEYTNEIYRTVITNLSFLSADGQTLLTLSGPKDHPIMQNALSTLEFTP